MEDFRIYIEEVLAQAGAHDGMLHLGSHAVMVAMAVALAWLSFVVCYRMALPLTLKIARHTPLAWDDILFNERTLRAACRIVPAIVIWKLLPVIFGGYPFFREVLARLTAVYIVVMSVRLAVSVINSLKRFEDERRSALQQYYNNFCGVLKIAAVFLGVVVTVAIVIGRSPLTLLAGLGATSAVMMLVFKDTITGLVAGVQLTTNHMLKKGDWITVPAAGADGTVESISITTVKVRNFDNTIVTVTPQTLVAGSFKNWQAMKESGGRRVKRVVCFDFRTVRMADGALKAAIAAKGYMKMEEMGGAMTNATLFRLYCDKWLKANRNVNTGLTYMVRQLEAGVTGMPLEFYFFLHERDWKPYEMQLAEIMETVYAIAPDFGLAIYQRVSDGERMAWDIEKGQE